MLVPCQRPPARPPILMARMPIKGGQSATPDGAPALPGNCPETSQIKSPCVSDTLLTHAIRGAILILQLDYTSLSNTCRASKCTHRNGATMNTYMRHLTLPSARGQFKTPPRP